MTAGYTTSSNPKVDEVHPQIVPGLALSSALPYPGPSPLAVSEAGEGSLGVQLGAPDLLQGQGVPRSKPVIRT